MKIITTAGVKFLLTGALLAGCASGGGSRQPYSGEPSAAPRDGAATPLPDLPVAQTVNPGGPSQRIQQLVTYENDLRAVIRGLAESYGLDYQIDPAVTGLVTTSLRDVTLTEALDAIVLPHGYDYQIDGRVLRVTRSRLQTKIFTLDYLSMSRIGSGTTTIQRQLSRAGSGGGAFGGGAFGGGAFGGGAVGAFGGGGGDVIQTVSVADLWQEIRVSMEGLVFSSVGGGAATGAQPSERISAPVAYSRSSEDGRRLIINPISGTVMVTGPPELLAEVSAFLTTIEGSVQRQVLIEAKIVEVSLNRRFEYGIDWSFVQRIGNINIQFANNPSGGQFTLASPSGETERQINLVLRVLEEQGDVSVLQSPSVRGLNNQWAVINASTDQVFFSVTREPILGPGGTTIGFDTQIQPQQISVGVTLNVLPQISSDNTITMNVRPVITDVIAEKSVMLPDGTQSTAPVIDRRESDTVVRIRNGETVVIGGLMTTKETNTGFGIPVLREIPVVGALFGGAKRQIEKRELVIFITPRIVAGQTSSVF
jgi:MSHA biogenesis protein MshL